MLQNCASVTCISDWLTGVDISPSDAYSLREIIIVAAYVIGGTVGLVLIIAIILTAIQRALLLRQARARVCRDGAGSRRQLVGEQGAHHRGGPGSNAAADRPPSYDEVLGSPDQYASRSAANRGANPPLLTTDDVIRPPSYDDALVQNTAAK